MNIVDEYIRDPFDQTFRDVGVGDLNIKDEREVGDGEQ